MQVNVIPQDVDCKEKDCNNTFHWNGYGIKPNRCPSCRVAKNHQKQIEYAERSRQRKQEKLAKHKKAAFSPHGGKSPKGKGGQKKRTSWENKPTKNLILHVQYQIVNPYIRERDKALFKDKCISCEYENIHEAGHRFPVSSHPGMRFMVNNIHGQGHHCNSHLDGNCPEYDNGLIRRFGVDYFRDLHETAQLYQQGHLKLMRHEIIEIGRTYKHLLDNRIWVLHQKAFDKYRNIINGNI